MYARLLTAEDQPLLWAAKGTSNMNSGQSDLLLAVALSSEGVYVCSDVHVRLDSDLKASPAGIGEFESMTAALDWL